MIQDQKVINLLDSRVQLKISIEADYKQAQYRELWPNLQQNKNLLYFRKRMKFKTSKT